MIAATTCSGLYPRDRRAFALPEIHSGSARPAITEEPLSAADPGGFSSVLRPDNGLTGVHATFLGEEDRDDAAVDQQR